MTKFFLVDSDVLIDYLRGISQANKFVQKHSKEIIISSIVVTELYAGIRGPRDIALVDNLLSLFIIISVSEQIARTGGILKNEYGKSHGISLADAIIAATSIHENAELKTLNVKHFPMIKGLKPAYRKSAN